MVTEEIPNSGDEKKAADEKDRPAKFRVEDVYYFPVDDLNYECNSPMSKVQVY
jgi:hypothetical protein